MMKISFRLLALFFLIIFMVSCSLSKKSTRSKNSGTAFKYPEFTEKDSLKGGNNRWRKCFDVTYYDLKVDVDIEKKYLHGSVDIYFTALSAADTIQIDLFSNMKIDTFFCENFKLSYYRKYDAVFFIFDKPLTTGSRNILTIRYEGKPVIAPNPPWDGGFVWKKDKKGCPWIGVACEQKGASLWWPCKDHLSDKPDSMIMSYTIPSDLFCVSNGRLINTTEDQEHARKTFTWKVHYPINTYNATLYIGKFKHFTIPYPKKDTSLDLDFYVLPLHVAKAEEHFKQAVTVLQTYEDLYGEYPFWKDGYKLVESPFEGMEHQTAIAYGNGFSNKYLFFDLDYIIVHESSHEWWGNSLTATDYSDIWLHEGFATYSEALYVEKNNDQKSYYFYMIFVQMNISNKQPVILPKGVNYWDYKDVDVYSKGAVILHSLRTIIGNDTVFYDILKTFYKQHQYSNATTEDFIRLVNEKTHKNMQWFFDTYLYRASKPVLEIADNYNKKKPHEPYKLAYRWVDTDSNFMMPIYISSNGKTEKITPTTKTQYRTIWYGDKVSYYTFDNYFETRDSKELKKELLLKYP